MPVRSCRRRSERTALSDFAKRRIERYGRAGVTGGTGAVFGVAAAGGTFIIGGGWFIGGGVLPVVGRAVFKRPEAV